MFSGGKLQANKFDYAQPPGLNMKIEASSNLSAFNLLLKFSEPENLISFEANVMARNSLNEMFGKPT